MTTIAERPETKVLSEKMYRVIRNHTIDSTWQLFELKFTANKVAMRLYLYRNCENTDMAPRFSHHIVVLMARKTTGRDAEKDYSKAQRIMRNFLDSIND